MNVRFFPIVFLVVQTLCSQLETEVFLFDVEMIADSIALSNKTNISNNAGYDNQPSFFDDNTVIFSATRNGQTDIRSYDINSRSRSWKSNTPNASEYSPQRMPNSANISAVKLDFQGHQRLHEYTPENDEQLPILNNDAKIGYYSWYDKNSVATAQLNDGGMDLVIGNFGDGVNLLVRENVGRSILKIPNTDLISFIESHEGKDVVWKFDPGKNQIKVVTQVEGIQDLCWINETMFLATKKNQLLLFNPAENKRWKVIKTFEDKDLQVLSRLAINDSRTKLALVSETSPAAIVDRQLLAFNSTNTELLTKYFAENVWVGTFPNEKIYNGRKRLTKTYQDLFKKFRTNQRNLITRITYGNKVIDLERVIKNKQKTKRVAIYEIENNQIARITYLTDETADDPVAIVQRQLEAYNSRDIDGFSDTYADDVELYNYPNMLNTQGKQALYDSYATFFETTPDLRCEIEQRIVLGNTVIDKESVTINGLRYEAVAIYEVEKGKIAKVTFVNP